MAGGLLALALLATTGCFPRQAGPGLSHFADQAPAIGAPAPRFELRGLDGETVSLDELVGERPLVLQLGSHSCPVYRYRRFGMRELWEEYRGRVGFLLLYTVEAHPRGTPSPYRDPQRNGGEWDLLLNRVVGVRLPRATDLDERAAAARRSAEALEIPYPVAVDGMDDAVWRAYGAAPSAGYVLDRRGRVVLVQPWIDPAEIRLALDRLLAQSEDGPGTPDGGSGIR